MLIFILGPFESLKFKVGIFQAQKFEHVALGQHGVPSAHTSSHSVHCKVTPKVPSFPFKKFAMFENQNSIIKIKTSHISESCSANLYLGVVRERVCGSIVRSFQFHGPNPSLLG